MVSKIYGSHVPRPNKAGQIGVPVAAPQSRPSSLGKTEFQKILQEQTGRVDFSAHANKRLEQRGIELSTDDMDRIPRLSIAPGTRDQRNHWFS